MNSDGEQEEKMEEESTCPSVVESEDCIMFKDVHKAT